MALCFSNEMWIFIVIKESFVVSKWLNMIEETSIKLSGSRNNSAMISPKALNLEGKVCKLHDKVTETID
ncbi:hypothetical protein KIN20_000425 [Parelaphostrongylus tenuis]|uniref:Uncharacterized protein n=1 Tax=Parelaphostrongylus tenuis TaxID=148309 RepID=A0AAD5QBU4_PARTN|nr:hypothetical protein KIN20_000425 [Parelaphostrongylus tenuis]